MMLMRGAVIKSLSNCKRSRVEFALMILKFLNPIKSLYNSESSISIRNRMLIIHILLQPTEKFRVALICDKHFFFFNLENELPADIPIYFEKWHLPKKECSDAKNYE
jgi:hypothetical protein